MVNTATRLTITATVVAITGAQAVWISHKGIDPYALMLIAALNFIVVLIGMLGDTRTIIWVTAGVSFYTLLLWLGAPRATPLADAISQQFIAVVSSSISIEWGIAVAMISLQRISRQTLLDMGALQLANEQARQLSEIKDMFITSVNHELRTPVMAVMGLLDLALAPVQMPTERRQTLVARARDASLDLVELLQSILDIRRMEQFSDDLVLTPVMVAGAIETAVGLIDPREGKLVERDLRLEIPPDLSVAAEPVRLRQVLVNLLSNAVKYSPPGSPIEITARLMGQPTASRPGEVANTVEIAVRDRGFGIPPAQIPLLFQRFVRLPRDIASTTIGNGLGLYLCRLLVSAMGGEIWVESTGIAGEGSTFFIRMAAAIPPAPVVELASSLASNVDGA